MAGKSNLDNIFLKQIRKQIRQDNFDKNIFLGMVNDFTESIYKPNDRALIAEEHISKQQSKMKNF